MSLRIERVVVTLDAASESGTAIETAARLAARTEARLHGIFVEDEDLFRLAGLPFARQVTLAAGTIPFTPAEAELQLRAAAERSRRDLLRAAGRHHVECSFETVRGGTETALVTAGATDLVVAGGATRPVAAHFRLGWRWWPSIAAATGPLLVVRRHWGGGGATVVVLRDRGPGSGRLIEAAVRLAEARDGAVRVICFPPLVDRAGLDDWVAEQSRNRPVRLQIEVAPADLGQLQQRLRQLDCSVLAIEAGAVESRTADMRELIERLACDILIVR